VAGGSDQLTPKKYFAGKFHSKNITLESENQIPNVEKM